MGTGEDLAKDPFEIPGHPLHTLRQENLAIEAFLAKGFLSRIEALRQEDSPALRSRLLEDVALLMQVERHYRRIEALMLPILESHGHVAASRVLSCIQRDILRMLRDLRDDLQRPDSAPQELIDFTAFLVRICLSGRSGRCIPPRPEAWSQKPSGGRWPARGRPSATA